jgi:hypothetical protein
MKQVYIRKAQSNKAYSQLGYAEIFKFNLESSNSLERSWMKIEDEINNLHVGDDAEKNSVRATLRFRAVELSSSNLIQVSTKSDLTFTRLENCLKETSIKNVCSNPFWEKHTQTTKKHEKDDELALINNIDSSIPLFSLTSHNSNIN